MEKKPRLYAYIRWSTDKQSDGDSKRRQLEMAHSYASQKGLELRPGDILIDEGVSAFTGVNATTGKLGGFLERVKAGKIPPGSILAIEGFDRLSRQAPLKAFRIFSDIIEDYGIRLITLNDGKEYNQKNINQIENLFLPLISFSTSNQESDKKQARLRASWEAKRANAGTEKFSRMCPGWLRPSSPHGDFHFELIPERVAVVKRIFEQSAAGIGMYVLCKTLNEENVPSFKISIGDGHWSTSSIHKLLNNPAVLGLYQPYKRIGGKKEKEGDPIPGYYPAIIDEDLFNKAAASRRTRITRDVDGKKHPVGGRKGENFPNLFTGIHLYCAYCGSLMRRRVKGGISFICSKADRGLGCEKRGWNYRHFETSFLAHVEEFHEHLTSKDEISAIGELQKAIDNDKARLSGIENRMDDFLEQAKIPKVKEKLQKWEDERILLAATIATKEEELNRLTSQAKAFNKSRDEITVLVERIQEGEGEDLYRRRAVVNAALKDLVKYISVGTVGFQRKPSPTSKLITLLGKNIEEDFHGVTWEEAREDGLTKKQYLATLNARYFQVVFQNGEPKMVHPEADAYEGIAIKVEDKNLVKVTTTTKENEK
jgi:DNA invertase Pin-like site-specific DNA recombinase